MKKIILSIGCLFISFSTFSQTAFDANAVGSNDIYGNARYMSMAGAFGALGGNASAIVDNPAGLGIFRKSEISTTLNFKYQSSSSDWSNQNSSKFGLDFGNLSLVIASETNRSRSGNTSGLLTSNWNFSYNKIKSFDRNIDLYGKNAPTSIVDYIFAANNGVNAYEFSNTKNGSEWDNDKVSWLSLLAWKSFILDTIPGSNGNSYYPLLSQNETVDPSYRLSERGSINRYSFAWSGNFSNIVYLGASIDYTTINHSISAIYDESFKYGGNFKLQSYLQSTGYGFGFNIGAIIRPIENLRFGVAFHTPSIYKITDHTYSEMYTDFRNRENNRNQNTNYGYNSAKTPNDIYYDNTYHLQSPIQTNLSAAYIFGKKALFSLEYVYNNNTGMKLMDYDGNTSSYDQQENNDIKNMLKDIHTIKLGLEYNINSNFSVRGGYALKTASLNSDAIKYLSLNSIRTDTQFFVDKPNTNYLSLGFGYHESSWFIDFAYMRKMYRESFYAFPPDNITRAGLVKTAENNFVASVGFKF